MTHRNCNQRTHAHVDADRLTVLSLYYYRTRYYDTGSLRSISEDLIGLPARVNFYRYVKNSPIGRVDPRGYASCENCRNADPMMASSPACDAYGTETYQGVSLLCFCKCAGDGTWAMQVILLDLNEAELLV